MANGKRKTRRKILIFSLIVVVVGGLTAWALLRKREPVITVQTEKIARRNLTELVPANGRIQPVFQVKISPEVSGEITELAVKEGYNVKKGDLLLKIKPDFYAAGRNSAEASYKGSLANKQTGEANLQKAEFEFKRIEELYKNKLVSDSAYQEAETGYEIAKAQLLGATHQVSMAQAALKKADEDLSKTTIVSPLDGTVSRLNSQLGERVVGTAMMAGTEIMTIADLTEMEARVDVGEIDVVLIALGQNARLEVDAFRDKKFNGAVTEIANSSKTSYQSSGGSSQEATKFEVKIRIKEKEIFRPGMSVTAEIEARSRTNVVCVPNASVTTRLPKEASAGDKKKGKADQKGAANTASAKATNSASARGTNAVSTGGTNAVSTAETNVCETGGTNASSATGTNTAKSKEGKKPGEGPKPIEVVFLADNGKAKMVPVKRGISDDSYVEITEGLREGQEVISGGYKAISRELEDGKKIKVGPAKSEADKEKEKK